MFVLTESDYDDSKILGVFTSVENAKQYVAKLRQREDLRWSTPNLVGSMWVDSAGYTLVIAPAELDPKL